MEKLKSKTIKTVIACAVMFLAISSLIGYGVWAVLSGQFNFGGNISFSAKDVNATVTKGTANGLTSTSLDGKMEELKFVPGSPTTGDTTTWSNLVLVLEDGTYEATITFTITNDSTTKALNVACVKTDGTENEMSMTVSVGETEGVTQTTDYTNVKISAGKTATYTVKFTVTDKTADASISGFGLAFTLTMANA